MRRKGAWRKMTNSSSVMFSRCRPFRIDRIGFGTDLDRRAWQRMTVSSTSLCGANFLRMGPTPHTRAFAFWGIPRRANFRERRLPFPAQHRAQALRSPRYRRLFLRFQTAFGLSLIAPMNIRTPIALLVTSCALAARGWGAGLSVEQVEFFEKKIRPVFVAECYECHGGKKQKGGLALDSREGLRDGGESGAAIVPGKPEESLLIRSITHAINRCVTRFYCAKD